MLASAAAAVATAHRIQQWPLLQHLWLTSRHLVSGSAQPDTETLSVTPGSLLHICCTNPHTHVKISNRSGQEDTVTLQATTSESPKLDSSLQERFLIQQIPGGRIIDVVEHAASSSSNTKSPQQQQQQGAVLAGTIPSRFCGLSVTTSGGSVTVGQLQEADLHLSTSGGDVNVARCRAHNASINTAVQAADQQQQQQQQGQGQGQEAGSCHGGSIQVDELSASRVSVYSGGAPVTIKRLFGLTVDVLSAGGHTDIGSIYADRAAVSAAGPSTAASTAAAGSTSSTAVGHRAAAAGAAGACISDGLHVGHIACLKGEARLESGGGPLEVDGMEGNAVLLSKGGDVKVHLHEHAGLVYVDSDGGSVTAWLSPSGTPLGLQVKAAGGVSLDPQLKVTGEVGATMLYGVTSGDGTISTMSSQTSAMVQQAVETAQSSAGAGGADQVAFSSTASIRNQNPGLSGRWKRNEQQVAAWSQQTQQQAQAQETAAMAVAGTAGGCGSTCGCSSSSSSSTASSPVATRQLIINAGWGRVELKAMGWMDGLKARMQAKQQQTAGS